MQWEYVNSIKPDPNVNHPDDIKAIEEAERTIGDYKLKCDPNFLMSEGEEETSLTKYKQLVDVRQEVRIKF